MRLLLDTHAFLWFVVGDARLGRNAKREMEKPGAELFLSAATVWEMAIKASVGKLSLPLPVHRFVAEKIEKGLRPLPVDWSHAAAVEDLPLHHKDPFDRLLVAQAQAEGLQLVSSDPLFRLYGVKIVW